MNRNYLLRVLWIVYSLVTLSSVSGLVEITEVMYNPSSTMGADNDLEWVELYVSGTVEGNLTNFTIQIQEKNTTVDFSNTTFIILVREYMDSGDSDNASFFNYYNLSNSSNVTILESDFTLPNKGGSILVYLKDSLVDEFTYQPEIGGDGDGSSVEKVEGLWIPSVYGGTPGSTGGYEGYNDSTNTISNTTNTTDAVTNSTATDETTCDASILLDVDRTLVDEGDSIRYTFTIEGANRSSESFGVEYWIDDIFGVEYRASRVTTSLAKKSFTPKIEGREKAFVIRAILYSGCEDDNMTNNEAEIIINVRSDNDNTKTTECEAKTKPSTVTPKNLKITYGFENVPGEYISGDAMPFSIIARNPTDKFHTVDVWSYVYKGSVSYSGDREANRKTINLPEHSTVRFDLVNVVNRTGEYKVKVKLLRDDRKTANELTAPITVTEIVEDTPEPDVETGVVEDARPVLKIEDPVPEKSYPELEQLNMEVLNPLVYQSPSSKAKSYTSYMIMGVLSLLLCLIILKKL